MFKKLTVSVHICNYFFASTLTRYTNTPLCIANEEGTVYLMICVIYLRTAVEQLVVGGAGKFQESLPITLRQD